MNDKQTVTLDYERYKAWYERLTTKVGILFDADRALTTDGTCKCGRVWVEQGAIGAYVPVRFVKLVRP